MSRPTRSSSASFCAILFLSLGASALLSGCANETITNPAAISVTGNWQIASTAAAASKLSALSGAFTGTSASLTGILHSNSASACIAPAAAFGVTGSTNSTGITTVTGANVAGGVLTLSGNLAANGRSFSNATYNVVGGSCAFAAAVTGATAQDFAPITGNYTGSFSDSNGQVLVVAAALTQSPSSDANGNFTLSGTGTFPSNPCFNSPVTVSNTQVTGGSFTFTYADPTTQNSVTSNGTFSTDGTTLTVTNWTLTGPCGPDSGTGLLTQH
jgi:hypothetical protein